MRHEYHLQPVMQDTYRCCLQEIHADRSMKDDTHIPCPHGLSAVIETREVPCDCDE